MSLRTWNLLGVPGPPRMELSLPQAGAKSGLQMLDSRMAQPVGSVLPHLLEQIIWKAQRGAVSHPQSHSTCVTVLDKNAAIPRLPVTPSKALLVPADLLLTPLPGLCILVSPEENGQAGQELPLPSSTAKKILDSALPALPATSPHFSLSPRNTHMHTHHSPFSTLPTFPPPTPPTPWPPGLEGTPKIIWFSSPHSELPFGCLPKEPCQDFSIFFLHTSKDGELTTSQDRLLFGLL